MTSLAPLALLVACGSSDTPSSDDTGGTDPDDGNASYDGPDGDDADGGSGGAEDTGFGMDDDMPLVTVIPRIKLGEIAVGSYVTVDGAVVGTAPGALPGGPGFFLRDPDGLAFAGLRVVDAEELQPPSPGDRARFTGIVARDEHGPKLRLERTEQYVTAEEPDPVRAELASVRPGSSDRDGLLDMELRVEDGTGQPIVVGDELEPGLWALAEGLVLDLRPFDVTAPELMSGASLESVTGVLMLMEEGSALLLREPEGLEFSQ